MDRQKLIANLAEIFVPLLPILICGGLLLGLRNVIGEMPISDNKPSLILSLVNTNI